MAQIGKSALLRCPAGTRITMGPVVGGVSELCGSRAGGAVAHCNGVNVCPVSVPTDYAKYNTCKDQTRFAIFGSYRCLSDSPKNLEVWTPKMTNSRTPLYEGRTMENRCTDGTAVVFFNAIYGSAGTCKGVDVTRALNEVAGGRPASRISLNLKSLGLSKNPCEERARISHAFLTTQGIWQR